MGVVVGKLGTAVVSHHELAVMKPECKSTYTIVTGATRLHWFQLPAALIERGVRRIIAVHNSSRADKFRNLSTRRHRRSHIHKQEFLDRLLAGDFDGDVDAILHQGACLHIPRRAHALHEGSTTVTRWASTGAWTRKCSCSMH